MILSQNYVKNIALFRFKYCKVVPKRKKYYLTTPIFYVNAKPHIGHLYTAVIADAVFRYQQIKYPDKSFFFMTGTDEHGLKIQTAAKQNVTPELNYVNYISDLYKDLFGLYDIQYSDFLRTSEKRHIDCVQSLWTRLLDNGHIYLGEYSGWYCMADEAFVPENQLQTLPDGKKTTLDGNRPVEFFQEANYKFRLSSFRDRLLGWLKGDVVRPEKFKNILRDWVEEGGVLDDISVSRPRSRVWWGVPVPGDASHTVYVWLDALACYLSSAGHPGGLKAWPPDLQIIGKDILKFHGVYWPAFLLGAGLAPPRQLLCHSHWVIDGEKMSKSKGNVVDPRAEAERFTYEGLRYFLLREGTPHSDANYSSVKIQRFLNAELADTLGNLLNRCTGASVNPRQVFPPYNSSDHRQYCQAEAQQLIESVEALPDMVDKFYTNFEFYKGIAAIMATLHLANGFFEREKPWELRKVPESSAKLSAILHVTMETLRVCGILLYPIVPQLSGKLLNRLSIQDSRRSVKHLRPLTWQQPPSAEIMLSPEKVMLFQRLR